MVRHAASAARPDEIRQHNLSLILSHIHRDGALTRAELTARLSLSRSTVGALVSELTHIGLVEEVVPTGGKGVGRPSHVVTPRRDGPYAVAVDVDVAYVTVAAVALGGDVLAREVISTGKGGTTPAAVVNLIARAIPRLHQAGCPDTRPAGIGVSVPGAVDRRTGRVEVAPNLDWTDVELGTLLHAAVPAGVPVAVGNDADLAVLAEHQRGSARDCDDVVYLMGRVGVGAGIIVGGVPLRGYNGHAGEIGHNVLDPSGPPCHCGKRGCTETYVGDRALLALAGRSVPPSVEAVAVAEVYRAARAGDAVSLAATYAVAEPLGRMIANLLNTLDPRRVTLGGSFAELLELCRAPLEASVQKYTFGVSPTVQLVAPSLGKDSALLGAAEIAFADLLGNPLAATPHVA